MDTKSKELTPAEQVTEIIFNIRKVREANDYTQEFVAGKLGISQNAYSKLELGYTVITAIRLIELAVIFKLNVHDLINPINS